MRLALAAVLALTGCCPPADLPKPLPASDLPDPGGAHPDERHFEDLRQLTFGGENAEAYWSFEGDQLVFQASPPGSDCDQIFRMELGPDGPSEPQPVSNGEGATTCAYFLPGDREIIYASTHLGGSDCPPKPDRSQGYVWPLYDSYDIFKVPARGGEPQRLTDTPGYDAEATVCPVDGSILFTSVRDGDLELYRMDADGKNVKRLTDTPGYDGGGFFSADCSQIVWRASRPTGSALADYQRLLKQNLVRPTKLELWVADADGSNARQVTYLNAASFAPYFFPSAERILFSSNLGDPKGREFDMWAVNVDGTQLERITYTPGFDGFPMFSPDGQRLAFASNRATAPGAHDTNLFVASWKDQPILPARETAADRTMADVRWLAAPARDGRGIGTEGLQAAGAYIEKRFGEIGLEPGLAGGYRQVFEVPTSVREEPAGTKLTLDGKEVDDADFAPLPMSGEGNAEGSVVLAGYGILSEDDGIDDYAGVAAKGKVVLVRRFVPDSVTDETKKRRFSDLRFKAWVAKERGAKALLVVDLPERETGASKDAQPPEEAPFPKMHVSGYGDADIPVLIIKRSVGAPLLAKLSRHLPARAQLAVDLTIERTTAFNLVGRLPANVPQPQRLPGVVVLGAHYDHLGHGGPGSLAPDSDAAHLGADDNASGVAALIEAGRQLAERPRRRDMLLIAFSGEESGILGSSHFVKNLPKGIEPSGIVSMINMDMVGRLRDNQLTLLGAGSADEWPALIDSACKHARLRCKGDGDGYGPSDQTPFYAAGVPVLHLFTGAHRDYHKPSDSADRINAAGLGQIAEVATLLATATANRKSRLTYLEVSAPPPSGDLRSYGASLGSIPDYAGPPKGQKGVLLAGVREGGAAAQAGLKRGDILIKLSKHDIGDVRDLMYALMALKPGQTVTAVVMREGKRMEFRVTLHKSRRRHK